MSVIELKIGNKIFYVILLINIILIIIVINIRIVLRFGWSVIRLSGRIEIIFIFNSNCIFKFMVCNLYFLLWF